MKKKVLVHVNLITNRYMENDKNKFEELHIKPDRLVWVDGDLCGRTGHSAPPLIEFTYKNQSYLYCIEGSRLIPQSK